MTIKRSSGTFRIVEKTRNLKMIVDVNRTEEAIALIRHAAQFYTEDTGPAPKRRRVAAVEEAAPEKEKKTKKPSPFRIVVDGEKMKPGDYVKSLIGSSKSGKLKRDVAIENLSAFAKGKPEKKKIAAQRAIDFMLRSPQSGLVLSDDGANILIAEN